MCIAALALLATSLSLGDRRSPWERYVTAATPDPTLTAFVGKGTVYWEGEPGLLVLWLKLHRPSYYSCLQGIGGFFFRATAVDYARRQNALRQLDTTPFGDPACGSQAHPGAHGPTQVEQLVTACQALPDLDRIILNEPVPDAPLTAVWRAPVPENDPPYAQSFYRYDCANFR